MPLEYDEIRITTRREIAVCEQAIKKLEKTLAGMEKKYGISSTEFLQKFDPSVTQTDTEMLEWYESHQALQRWRQRLVEHWLIMEM